MPASLPDWDGIIRDIDRSFVRPLRRQLKAQRYVTGGNNLPHIGIKTHEWWEKGDDEGNVQVTMNIPEMTQSENLPQTKREVSVPGTFDEIHWDGRELASIQAFGFDATRVESLAHKLAREHNDRIWLGSDGGDISGTNTGLLNDPNSQTTDVTGDGNWNNGEDMVQGLNIGIREHELNEFEPPHVALMSKADRDLFGAFINDQSVQVREKMPDDIAGVDFIDESIIPAGEMFLMTPGRENWVYMSPPPFGVANFPRLTKEDGQLPPGMWTRWWHIGVLKVKRPKSIMKVDFDRT